MFIIESIKEAGMFWDCICQEFGIIDYADVFPTVEAANLVLSETKGEGYVRAVEPDEEIFFDEDEIGVKGGEEL